MIVSAGRDDLAFGGTRAGFGAGGGAVFLLAAAPFVAAALLVAAAPFAAAALFAATALLEAAELLARADFFEATGAAFAKVERFFEAGWTGGVRSGFFARAGAGAFASLVVGFLAAAFFDAAGAGFFAVSFFGGLAGAFLSAAFWGAAFFEAPPLLGLAAAGLGFLAVEALRPEPADFAVFFAPVGLGACLVRFAAIVTVVDVTGWRHLDEMPQPRSGPAENEPEPQGPAMLAPPGVVHADAMRETRCPSRAPPGGERQ